MENKRLDLQLKEWHQELSRSQIQELITIGAVTVNGRVITQSSFLVKNDALITVDKRRLTYVSRAGLKLEHALQTFSIVVKDLVCLDAGLSTGGFTDCLLRHGAQKVYGIDVGTAQVDPKIAGDNRVIVMENTDIRRVPVIPDIIDCVTLDLSFISIIKVIYEVARLVKPGGMLIVLIKPQFEVGLEIARRHKGVILDGQIHKAITESVIKNVESAGFECRSLIESLITGGSGNKEFLAYFVKKY